jgi:hypothetical protein
MENRNGPTRLRLEVLNESQGDALDLEQFPELLQRPVDEAFQEALRIARGVPEAAFRPTAEHDVVVQPSSGYARPIFDLGRTLGEVLSTLQGEEATIRVSSQARQADPWGRS